jgi:hypothetical protein
MTEDTRASGATTAYEEAGFSPLSVPAHRTGGRRPVLVVTAAPGPGRRVCLGPG